jgi:hypothetical protein
MKIVPKNKGRCILEVEELLEMTGPRDQNELIQVINDSGASRKSYNEWLFPDLQSAEDFVFMYRLKYED